MTDVIKLEAECLTELAKKLQAARSALQTALPKLKTARMSSGWFTSSREIINNDIDTIMREVTNQDGELNILAGVLLKGATTYTQWENNLRSNESQLSSALSKVWAFEAENFESGANADKKAQIATTDVPQNPNGTPSGNSSAGSQTLAGRDLSSGYYTQNMSGVPRTLINEIDGQEHMNCVYYARARAMEANQLGSYAPKGSGNEIRANSIASFAGHDVFIENVSYGSDGNPASVTISEGNWADGKGDGAEKTLTWQEFLKRGNVNKYTYF
ncbi:MAG: hypothetical protein LBF92_00925 [Synergistaceae bacterium]|jgi:hypothetical protein|nr:hypothetical protein [Synergistaceae bacterium]